MVVARVLPFEFAQNGIVLSLLSWGCRSSVAKVATTCAVRIAARTSATGSHAWCLALVIRRTPLAPPFCWTKFAIPIALYRPQIGPPARNGKKNGRKMDFGPTGKGGGEWHKWENWPKNGSKMGQKCHFPIFDPFLPFFFPVGPNSIFRPFCSHFGPEAQFGVCTGQLGSPNEVSEKRHEISNEVPEISPMASRKVFPQICTRYNFGKV